MSGQFQESPRQHHEDALDKSLLSVVASCTPSLWDRTMNWISAQVSHTTADSANELEKQNCLRRNGFYEMQDFARRTALPDAGQQYESPSPTTPAYDSTVPTTAPIYQPAQIGPDGSIEFNTDKK
jgi:hypothetical protein